MNKDWEILNLKNRIKRLEEQNSKLKKTLINEKVKKSRARILHIQR